VRLAHLAPRGALHRSMLVLVVSFAAFIASGAASAGSFPVIQFCTSVGQLCSPIPTFNITIPAPGGEGQARFIPGPLTCSNVRIHFFIDGTEVAVSGFVAPGGKTDPVSLGFVSPGAHIVGVQAEGEVSGCNIGNLLSWAGTVKLRKAP
jgi:hypothetical protein